jgi:hypothetical protein
VNDLINFAFLGLVIIFALAIILLSVRDEDVPSSIATASCSIVGVLFVISGWFLLTLTNRYIPVFSPDGTRPITSYVILTVISVIGLSPFMFWLRRALFEKRR